MGKRKCDECGKLSQFVFMSIIEEDGSIRYVHLCEKCFRKHEKPFKE